MAGGRSRGRIGTRFARCYGMPYASKERRLEYDRKWRAKRRAAFFDGKSCVKCGSAENLELDHIDRETKVKHTDHLIWSLSEPKRLAEIAKCQVLCHGCHAEKTRIENTRFPDHGLQCFWRGCRCDVCRSAGRIRKNQERKLWRARKNARLAQ